MGEPESRTAEEKAKSFARLIELKHEHMARAGSRGYAVRRAPTLPPVTLIACVQMAN